MHFACALWCRGFPYFNINMDGDSACMFYKVYSTFLESVIVIECMLRIISSSKVECLRLSEKARLIKEIANRFGVIQLSKELSVVKSTICTR